MLQLHSVSLEDLLQLLLAICFMERLFCLTLKHLEKLSKAPERHQEALVPHL